MKKKNGLRHISFIIVGILMFAGCAKEMSPEGGPRDVSPPKIKTSKPKNGATNYKKGSITLTFDEYIQLENAAQNLIVSPPLAEKPRVRTNGKKAKVRFDASQLKDSTTYSFVFNKMVKDLNEGNVLPTIRMVFSTGDSIDNMRVRGMVIDSRTMKPCEDVYVSLYDDMHDSAPKRSIPMYLTKTDKEGRFDICNAKKGTYKIYALKDANNNLKFDQPKELIAFVDTAITPNMIVKTSHDTLKAGSELHDTLRGRHLEHETVQGSTHNGKRAKHKSHHHDSSDQHTVKHDTVITRVDTSFTTDSIVLYMFEETKKQQHVNDVKRERKEKIVIIFNRPLIDEKAGVHLLYAGKDSSLFIEERNTNNDSLTIWLTDTALRKNDSILIRLSYIDIDSMNNPYVREDTLTPRYEHKKDPLRGKLKCQVVFPVKQNASLDTRRGLFVEVNEHVKQLHAEKFHLYETRDTLSLLNCLGGYFKLDSAGNEVADTMRDMRITRQLPDTSTFDQDITETKIGRNKFMLKCKRSVVEYPVSIEANGKEEHEWMVRENDATSNTVYCWITKPEAFGEGKMTILVKCNGKTIDTIYHKPKRTRQAILSQVLPVFVTKRQQEELLLDERLAVVTKNPIDSVDTAKISLVAPKDTSRTNLIFKYEREAGRPRTLFLSSKKQKAKTYILTIKEGAIVDIYGNKSEKTTMKTSTQKPQNNPVRIEKTPIEVTQDSLSPRKYKVLYPWEEKKTYVLTIGKGAFLTMLGLENDSSQVQFSIPSKDSYGKLIVKIGASHDSTLVLQVLDRDGKETIAEEAFTGDNEITFDKLSPSDYRLKIIYDANRNKKWDTGDLLRKIQPEKTSYMMDQVKVKANWENKIEWLLDGKAKEEIEPGKQAEGNK